MLAIPPTAAPSHSCLDFEAVAHRRLSASRYKAPSRKTAPPQAQHAMPYAAGQPFELPVYKGDLAAETSGLLEVDWVQQLLREPGVVPVLTAGALVSKDSELPPDHMFSAFLKVGLLHDMLCLYHSAARRFHTLITLGDNVCGHPHITHGGMTAAIMDESLGGLSYMLKKDGLVGKGPSFTVHLEVDYKAPIPAASHVLCSAALESCEGRKTWARAEILDRPGGRVFATARALFVIPRDKAAAAAAAAAEAEPGSGAAAAANGGPPGAAAAGAGAAAGESSRETETLEERLANGNV